MAIHSRVLFSVLAALSLQTAEAPAEDWASWRGPRADGSATLGPTPASGELGLEPVWRREVGSGYSGLSIAGQAVCTMASDGEGDFVVVLAARDGAERFRVRLGPANRGRDGSEDGPLSTPVVADGRIIALSSGGRLVALDLEDGREIWSRDLAAAGARGSHFGFVTTPLVVGPRVVVQTSGGPGKAVTAFDAATGEELWATGDDTTEYQSPIHAVLLGRPVVVFVGNDLLLGLDPATGDEVWRIDHGPKARYSTAHVVPVGGDRLVVGTWPETALFALEESGGAIVGKEVWRATTLDARLGTPVYHDGRLYGFDGKFLSAVDIATGTSSWKSRPPGGGGLLRVDDRLLVHAADGDVVLARADGQGFVEEARAKATGPSTTYPSFADGVAYVRDTSAVAAVRVVARTASQVPVAAPAPPEGTVLARLVAEVERSTRPRGLVDEFMADPGGFPRVEDGGWVHFLYRGAAKDVAVAGSFNGWSEVAMQRVSRTDLFWHSVRFDPGVRFEYRFNVDFDHVQPDPLNPRRVADEWEGDWSESALAPWREPAHLRPYRGGRPGRLETFSIAAPEGAERTINVYLPHGFEVSAARRPLAVVLEGDAWLEKGDLPAILDHLVGTTVEPLVVALIGGGVARDSAASAEAAWLADRVVPEIERRYRTRDDSRSRAILGRWGGAAAALHAALLRPDRFGLAAGESVLAGDLLQALVAGARARGERAARFHVGWNRYERFDGAAHSRALSTALREGGKEVTGGEHMDSAGWGAWRNHVADVLRAFFPAPTAKPDRR